MKNSPAIQGCQALFERVQAAGNSGVGGGLLLVGKGKNLVGGGAVKARPNVS